MTLYAFHCQWLGGEPQCLGCDDLRWVTLDQLDAFAFPVADQKIIATLRDRALTPAVTNPPISQTHEAPYRLHKLAAKDGRDGCGS